MLIRHFSNSQKTTLFKQIQKPRKMTSGTHQENKKEKVSCDPDQEISSNPDGDRTESKSSETASPIKKRKVDFIIEDDDDDDDEVSSREKASDEPLLYSDEIEESKNKSSRRVQITVGSILHYIGKQGNGGPGSGLIPMSRLCLSKILTSFDVIPLHAKLHLDSSEASELSSPKLAKDDSNSYLEPLIGFDEQDRKYEMMLLRYICGESIRYWLCGGWTQFVRNHGLKPGDEINFYKGVPDEDVSKEGYFILRYFRRPLDSINKKTTIQGGPGSRALPPEAYCISKVLTSDDVDPDKSMLKLDTYEASILAECPEIVGYDEQKGFRKVLIAYDEQGAKYDMDLCHVASETEKVYAVSDEWIYFAWDHKLEAGDVISFYKNIDTSIVRDGYYYIVKYERKSKEEDQGDDHHENDNGQVMVKEKVDNRTCDGEDDEVKQKALGSEI